MTGPGDAGGTVLWQRLEGAAVALSGAAIFAFSDVSMAWWAILLIFLAPDLTFAAYLGGPRIGAFFYNLVHVYGFGAVALAVGHMLNWPLLVALGALWLAHSGVDRLLGYGLKSTQSFNETHLGRVGRPA